jgi:hypothetical protein
VNELDVLRGVREALKTDWWAGYDRKRDDRRRCGSVGPGENCLVLHLGDAAGRDLFAWEAACDLVVRQIGGDDPADIPPWNDTHTYEEVCSLVDDLIAKLEEQEAGAPLPPLTTTSEPFSVLA